VRRFISEISKPSPAGTLDDRRWARLARDGEQYDAGVELSGRRLASREIQLDAAPGERVIELDAHV
jgi:hypothetical protein